MREFWSDGAGAHLRYLDLPGDRVPILFIHGLGCAGSHDYPQVAAQPEVATHRRILVDLLGAGYSDWPEGFPGRVSDHAEVVAELVEVLGLQRFVLFAHSAGGAIGLELARRVGERLAAVVLSEANLDPSPPGVGSFRIASQTEADFVARGFEELLAAARQEGNTSWAAALDRCSPAAVWRLAASLTSGQDPNGRDVLYELPVPRAYLFGERSLPDPDHEELPRHGVRVFVVPRAGHSMAWENPEGVAGAISAALAVLLPLG